MDGPDLSHILDDPDPATPPSDVLDGIVRRHKRLKVRRARIAASLGLVIALAGLGTGIGLNQHPTTRSVAGPPSLSSGDDRGLLPSTTTAVPGAINTLPRESVTAPKGLSWVSTGSEAGAGTAALEPSTHSSSGNAASSAELGTTGLNSGFASLCSGFGCPWYESYGFVGDANLTHLFTRTNDGVTVRAFTATWEAPPFYLSPLEPQSGVAKSAGSGTTSGGVTSSTVISLPPTAGTAVPLSPSASTGTIEISTPSTTQAVSSPPASGTTTSTIVASSLPVMTSPTDTTIPSTTGTNPVTSNSSGPTAVLPSTSCGVTQALVVEVSDAGAVGVVMVPNGASSTTQPIDVLSDQVVGIQEQAPIAVVVAHTTGQTTAVKAEFASGGQDEMAVVGQWAVLVQALATSSGGGSSQGGAIGQATVDALSSDGTVLEHADLPGSGALAMPVAACVATTFGASGASGASGAAGASGASGASGVSGASGSAGVGASGVAPTNTPDTSNGG